MPVTTIKSRWKFGRLEFYDTSTYETVDVMAPTKIMDDFTGIAVDSVYSWNVDVVNSGTAEVTAQVGGHLLVTTGGADTDDVEVASELVFEASKYPVCEARIRQDDIDGSAFNFGFTDAKTTGVDLLPVTYATTTLTSTATNCALWFQDPSATTDLYRCVGVNAGTDGTVVAVPAATATPTDAEWHTYRVEIDAAGNVYFWFDGDQIATGMARIRTTTNLCLYFGLINRESAANTAVVDYIRGWQNR